MTSPVRVAVRHRLPDGSATDVVGDLLAETGEVLLVLPDDAPPVEVSREALVARRVVPPSAVRPASSPDRLARLLTTFWPGEEVERLGGWILRAGRGVTRRANSTHVGGDPGVPADAARERVVAWSTARGIEPCLRVLDDAPVPPGWCPAGGGVVLTTDLRRAGTAPVRDDVRVDVASAPSAEWLGLWRLGADADARGELLACPATYLTLVRDDEAIGCLRVATGRRWAHLSCLEVHPAHRGAGLGRALVLAGFDLGRSAGASFVAVETDTGNAPSLALFTSAGLTEHHRYRYDVPTSAARGPVRPDPRGDAPSTP